MADAMPDVKYFAVVNGEYKLVDYILAHTLEDAQLLKPDFMLVEYDPENPPAYGAVFYRRTGKFVKPSPYPSWIFNPNTSKWEAPIPHPLGYTDEGQGDGPQTSQERYRWEEASEGKEAGWYLVPLPTPPADAPAQPDSNYRWIPELGEWRDPKNSNVNPEGPNPTPIPEQGKFPSIVYPV